MLYGAELWSHFTNSDLAVLERVNRLAAKRIQGLAINTMSEAALGNLGLWSISGYIEKIKLLFLQRLIVSHPSSVEKILFINRLCLFISGCRGKMFGFLPDIIEVLQKYELSQYLEAYIANGEFPSKLVWKNIICTAVGKLEQSNWRTKKAEKNGLDIYNRMHTKLEPLELWKVAWRNPTYIKPIANLINLFSGNIPLVVLRAVEETESHFTCTLCGMQPITAVVKHFVMDCQCTSDERNNLWETMHDKLPIVICARLFNQDDYSIYENIISGQLPFLHDDQDSKDKFAVIVAFGIMHICKKVATYLLDD